MIIITFDKRGTISLFTKQIIASCLQDGIWYVHHQQTNLWKFYWLQGYLLLFIVVIINIQIKQLENSVFFVMFFFFFFTEI